MEGYFMQFAQNLADLMKSNGVSNYRLAKETGSSATTVTNWLKGAVPGSDKLQRIADYFNISVDELLGKEKAPADNSEREIGFDDFTFAMHNHSGDLTDTDKEILLSMAHQLAEANKRKTNGETD
jgi:transcriptional regulator with XRE-family HTH domain